MDKPLPLPVRDRAEPGRGRWARTPSEVPVRGWKDILLRIWKNIGKDRVVVVAAGVTFYSILALFPAIAALVALYGLFADPAAITSHLDSIAGVVPGGAIEVMRDQITRVVRCASAAGFSFGRREYTRLLTCNHDATQEFAPSRGSR